VAAGRDELNSCWRKRDRPDRESAAFRGTFTRRCRLIGATGKAREKMATDQTEAPKVTAESFHDLVLGYLPALRAQALALTRNRPDADDLVQSAITSALAAKDSFAIGTNFRGWMTRILRNRFISNIRSRRQTVDIEDATGPQMARSGGQEDRIEIQELRRQLGKLPADQRLALIMVSVQGLSYEDTAGRLGIAVGTLKSRVSRARQQLLVRMYGEEHSEPPELARPTKVQRALPGAGERPASTFLRHGDAAESGLSMP
jgi:RNA polymerase sigma-70 factor (ECF subfamily)